MLAVGARVEMLVRGPAGLNDVFDNRNRSLVHCVPVSTLRHSEYVIQSVPVDDIPDTNAVPP